MNQGKNGKWKSVQATWKEKLCVCEGCPRGWAICFLISGRFWCYRMLCIAIQEDGCLTSDNVAYVALRDVRKKKDPATPAEWCSGVCYLNLPGRGWQGSAGFVQIDPRTPSPIRRRGPLGLAAQLLHNTTTSQGCKANQKEIRKQFTTVHPNTKTTVQVL